MCYTNTVNMLMETLFTCLKLQSLLVELKKFKVIFILTIGVLDLVAVHQNE